MKKNFIHPTDEALVLKSREPDTKVATNDATLSNVCEGQDWHVVSAEEIEHIRRSIDSHVAAIRDDFPRLIAACPHATRLAITAQVMRAIFEHAKQGGTMRHLIYNRLGFSEGDYIPLHLAGATVISNEFDLSNFDENAEIRRVCEKIGLNYDDLVAKYKENERDQNKPTQ